MLQVAGFTVSVIPTKEEPLLIQNSGFKIQD
jgi:hypothetical protein